MKLLYLGTAAAEGIPAAFCSCPICRTARERGGKDLRTRSQALLDGKILFDFPPDSYAHYLGHPGFDLPAIRSLFITHSHLDHCYPEELQMRKPPYAHSPVETLRIYGNEKAEKLLLRAGAETGEAGCNEFRRVAPFQPAEAEGYRVTPLPARHDPQEECLFYAAERGGKALLYAHDTGIFPEAAWSWLSRKAGEGLRFSLASLDCTSAKHKDGGGHMGIPDCIEVRDRLLASGAADGNTIFALNHFSHNGGLNHDELCRIAEKEGFVAAYDGLEIVF